MAGSKSTSAAYVYPIRSHPKYYFKPWSSTTIVPTWVATNIRFSWLQSASAGLYLVYNEVDDENNIGPIKKRREFAIKYSRIIDLL